MTSYSGRRAICREPLIGGNLIKGDLLHVSSGLPLLKPFYDELQRTGEGKSRSPAKQIMCARTVQFQIGGLMRMNTLINKPGRIR